MPTESEPEAPATPRAAPVRRRSSWLERITLAAFLAGLALFFVNYVLGGLDGAAYIWVQVQQAALDFATSHGTYYHAALLPLVAVVAYLMRHALPIIEIPLMGAGGEEAKWLHKWYWPGSFRIEDGEASWREGRTRAFVNKAFIARKGLFLGYGVTVPVERNVGEAAGEVTYDPSEVPAYESRTLHRRLQVEVRQRAMQEQQNLQGGRQP